MKSHCSHAKVPSFFIVEPTNIIVPSKEIPPFLASSTSSEQHPLSPPFTQHNPIITAAFITTQQSPLSHPSETYVQILPPPTLPYPVLSNPASSPSSLQCLQSQKKKVRVSHQSSQIHTLLSQPTASFSGKSYRQSFTNKNGPLDCEIRFQAPSPYPRRLAPFLAPAPISSQRPERKQTALPPAPRGNGESDSGADGRRCGGRGDDEVEEEEQ